MEWVENEKQTKKKKNLKKTERRQRNKQSLKKKKKSPMEIKGKELGSEWSIALN